MRKTFVMACASLFCCATWANVVPAAEHTNWVGADSIVYSPADYKLPYGAKLGHFCSKLPGYRLVEGKLLLMGHNIDRILIDGRPYAPAALESFLDVFPVDKIKDIVIKTYRETPMDAKAKGDNAAAPTAYELDIKTRGKKWTGEVEGGYGTAHRFEAKGFVSQVTKNARFSLYGAMNNINIKPEFEHGSWKDREVDRGISLTRMAGADYAVKAGEHDFRGNVQVWNNDDDLSRQNLMAWSGLSLSPYSLRMYNACDKVFGVSTRHIWEWKRNRFFLHVSPAFSFSRLRGFADEVDGVFTLQNPNISFWQDVLNRRADNTTFSGNPHLAYVDLANRDHRRTYDLNVLMSWATKRVPGVLKIKADHHFENGRYRSFSDYDITYGDQSKDRQQYYRVRLEKMHLINWIISYTLTSGGLKLTPSYQLLHISNTRPQTFYRLDRLKAPEEIFTQPIYILPENFSAADSNLIDKKNSFDAMTKREGHIMRFEMMYSWGKNNSLSFTPSLRRQKNYLLYNRALNIANKPLHIDGWGKEWLFEPSLVLNLGATQFSYSHSVRQAFILHMMPVLDTFDPLHLFMGKPKLKDMLIDAFAFRTGWRKPSGLKADLSAQWTIKRNAIFNAIYYSPKTGILTEQPHNMNGYWEAQVAAAVFSPLDAQKNLILSVDHHMNFSHAANMVSEQKDVLLRNSLNYFSMQDKVTLDWKVGKHAYGAVVRCNGNWANTRHSRDVSLLNTVDLLVGVKGLWSLTPTTELGTDLSYGRRFKYPSYIPARRWIWNAHITQHLLKRKLFLRLSSSDILDQDPAIFQTVDTRGRDLVKYDGLSRYIMLTAGWKF